MRATWLDDGTPVPTDALAATGAVYRELPTDPAAYQAPLDALSADRGYVTQDVVELSPEMENLDAICAKFDREHIHTDDEARFVLAGEGIFDLRATDNRWIRVEVGPGDLLVVPKGLHHRFLLTDTREIRCVRLFADASGWTPHYRD